jgi:lipopolysaccharide transport protein LptA
MHKYQKIIKFLLICITIFTFFLIFKGMMQDEAPKTEFVASMDVDGVEMHQSLYDEENRKTIELNCTHSRRTGKDKLEMQNIDARVLKKGKMNKDIRIMGDEGFAANNFHDFEIRKNGRIISEDFEIYSDKFFLKNRANLKSKIKVDYRTATLKGIARKGMEYYVKLNVIKFFDTAGKYNRNDLDHHYKTDILWFIENERKLIMQKKAGIRSERSVLKSDWVATIFYEDMKTIQEASAIGHSYLLMGNPDKEQNDFKEIKAQNIKSYYDEAGRLTYVDIMKEAQVLIASEKNRTGIRSELLKILFDPETEKVSEIQVLQPGELRNKGQTDFHLLAGEMNLQFEEGEVKFCRGMNDCRLKLEGYGIEANELRYNVDKKTVVLKGDKASVGYKNNLFRSSQFIVLSEKKVLASQAGVDSTISLGGDNLIFKDSAIFVNAQKINFSSQKETFHYEGNVHLTQDNTTLTAEKLLIGTDNNILAVGDVSLTFRPESDNPEGEISLKGQKVVFDPSKRRIFIENSAAIQGKGAILKADNLNLQFGKDNKLETIGGTKNIQFIKEDIIGNSTEVDWKFQDEIIVFTTDANLIRGKKGTSKGEKLEFDLKANKVLVHSDDTKRTETILD